MHELVAKRELLGIWKLWEILKWWLAYENDTVIVYAWAKKEQCIGFTIIQIIVGLYCNYSSEPKIYSPDYHFLTIIISQIASTLIGSTDMDLLLSMPGM